MTHPIETSHEAIAALLDGVTPGPWRVEHETTLIWGHCDQDDATFRGMGYPVSECRITPISSWASGPDADAGEANARFIAAARELVPALAAEIARLTAERDALNEELREARMQAIADGVQFQMDMEDLTAERDEQEKLTQHYKVCWNVQLDRANSAEAERDEARAQVAMAYEAAASAAQNMRDTCGLDQDGASYLNEDVHLHGCGVADAILHDIRALTPADATAAIARRDAAMRNEGRRQAAEIARADAQSETGPILRRRLSGSGTPVAASARRRQAIRTAHRILAALEPEGGE